MWTRAIITSKLRALAMHVGLSALIFLPFLYLILVHWFPPPLFFTDGGWQGVRIMLLVDIVIGPSLTFLIFNPAKSRREILFDFGCIGLVQAAALVYGYLSVDSKRIQAVAYHDGGFYAVTKDVFSKQLIQPNTWERLGERAPYWVFAREPANAQEEAGVFAWEFQEGIARHELAFLYEPLAAHQEEVMSEKIDWQLPGSYKRSTLYTALCADAATQTARNQSGIYCLPLHGYYRPAALLFGAGPKPIAWAVGEYGSKHGP